MLEIPCLGCGRKLRAQTQWVGKQIKCPQCQTVQSLTQDGQFVPTAPASSANPRGAADAPPAFFRDEIFRQSGEEAPDKEINPYASPATSYEYQGHLKSGQRPWEQQYVDIGAILERTWKLFSQNLGPCLLVGLVLIGQAIVSWVIGFVINNGAALSGDVIVSIVASILAQIITNLIAVWFQLGLALFGLRLARGEPANVGDLFAVGPYYAAGVLVNIIVFLIVIAISLVGLLPAAFLLFSQGFAQFQADPVPVSIAFVIGVLVALIPTTILGLNWFVAVTMVVDRQLPAMEALRSSWQFMKGNRIATFLAMLVAGLLGTIATLCTCGAGIVAYIPFLGLLPIVVYMAITGQPMNLVPSQQTTSANFTPGRR